jgi:aryl-alcohol dehydrogenase-like predicted oxidoreductase
MEERELGASGIRITRIVLGCGNFGGIGSAPELFGSGESQEEAFAIMDAAWELGITSFDTADAYGAGRSETAIGAWLRTKGPEVRDRIVVNTKTYNPMDAGHDRGLSRARILRQIDTSLQRLGLEHVPCYMAHEWDPDVPAEETLGAFDELVRAGKVGAVGASNWSGEQLGEALELSTLEGLTRYEWVQNAYSLLSRGDEEDVFPVVREQGLGYQAFGPLEGGWLTGKYRRGEPPPPGSRMTQRPRPYERLRSERVFDGLDAFARAAEERGVSTTTLALAWALSHPDVTAIVVGPRRPEHLDAVRDALTLSLTDGERDELAGLFA